MINAKQAAIRIFNRAVEIMIYGHGAAITPKKVRVEDIGSAPSDIEQYLNDISTTYSVDTITIDFYGKNGTATKKIGTEEVSLDNDSLAEAPLQPQTSNYQPPVISAMPTLLGLGGQQVGYIGDKDFLIQHYKTQYEEARSEISDLKQEIKNLRAERDELKAFKLSYEKQKELDELIAKAGKKDFFEGLSGFLEKNPEITQGIVSKVMGATAANETTQTAMPGLDGIEDDSFRVTMGQWIQGLKDKMDAGDREWIGMASVVLTKFYHDKEYLSHIYNMVLQAQNQQ
ncbi:MAG: hypothetical protein F9K23_15815 [Bacteroidetes bacterium]|nr:MAG: hypothetical protein F9K23_15815 [Bacteroidota bacterium]